MLVLIGVGSIAVVFLIWYVVVARPQRNAAKHDEFMKAVEDLTQHLDTEFAPAAKQMSEAMQSLCYASQRMALNLEGEFEKYMFKER